MFKIILLILFSIFNCKEYQVENLNFKLISKIKIGEDLESINGVLLNNAIINLPFKIPITSSRIYISDYDNSRIKVYNYDGKLDFIIGKPDKKNKDIKFVIQKFNKLGLITVSEEDDIYVQNHLNSNFENAKPESLILKNSGYFEIKESESIPSFILHINNRGKLESIIGKNGKNSEPFRYIENIYVYKKNKLFVYHKFAEQMQMSLFLNGDLKGTLEVENLNIFKSKENEEYILKLDTMIPNLENDYILASISFISKKDSRFKFRRIYKYDFNNTNNPKLLKEIYYPSEILFYSYLNDEFLVWETEEKGESVKLKVHDKNGNHINNKRFEFDSGRSNWREIYMDEKEKLYSIKVDSNFLELYRWE